MKRSEIQEGVAYAMVTSREGINAYRADKVVVINNRPHVYNRYRGTIAQASQGTTLLVNAPTYRNIDTNEWEYSDKVVELRHIVCTWEQYEARQAELKIERAKFNEYQEQARMHHYKVVEPKAIKIVEHLEKATGAYVMITNFSTLKESQLDYLIEKLGL
jgi:ribonucleotide monophosphatase NagD (HAD superfamily)